MTIEISPFEIHDLNHTNRITLLSLSMSGLVSRRLRMDERHLYRGSDPVATALFGFLLRRHCRLHYRRMDSCLFDRVFV